MSIPDGCKTNAAGRITRSCRLFYLGYCAAALLGTVTPFCSCSSIPLFMGFTSAGLPLGVTFSFLISSPMVDLGSLVVLMSICRQWSYLKTLIQTPQKIFMLAVSAVLIGGNWLLFIWAVNNHHMLEASLGYFINPLVNIVLGMIFLGERFRRMQWLAVILAICGVLVQLWTFGSLPIIALGLAFSFAFYGLVRKKIAVEAQTGMLIETMWLLPVAAIYLFAIADSSTSHMGQNPMSLNLLLIAAGIVTTVPLLCFTAAATRLRLSTLGFFQYIGPTLMFLLAVTFYGEKPGADKMVTFAFIWVALAIFVMDAIYTQRRTSK